MLPNGQSCQIHFQYGGVPTEQPERQCGGDPLQSGLSFLRRFALGVTIAAWLAAGAFAAEQPSETPAWLKSHIGDGEGQIAPVVDPPSNI
jgi:hypothetical protein